MSDTTPSEQSDYDRDARQLALVDRIIGLEAEIANLRSFDNNVELRNQLDEFRSSTTWRVGRLVLAPAFAVDRLVRRNRKR